MKFFYAKSITEGVPEYEVTLVLKYYGKKTFKTRFFDTEDDATAFFVRMQSIDKPYLLVHFLGHFPDPKQRVKHHVRCPDGSDSVWMGSLHGTMIVCDGLFYDTLALFASAHSEHIYPDCKVVKGWYEWETDVPW